VPATLFAEPCNNDCPADLAKKNKKKKRAPNVLSRGNNVLYISAYGSTFPRLRAFWRIDEQLCAGERDCGSKSLSTVGLQGIGLRLVSMPDRANSIVPFLEGLRKILMLT
jgi:hypothetical protein